MVTSLRDTAYCFMLTDGVTGGMCSNNEQRHKAQH